MNETEVERPMEAEEQQIHGRERRIGLRITLAVSAVVVVVVVSVLMLQKPQSSTYDSASAANSAAQSLGIDTSGIPPWQHQARIIRQDMVAIGDSSDPTDLYNNCNKLVGDTNYAGTKMFRPFSNPSRSWTWHQYDLVQSAIVTLNQAAADCRTIGQESMNGVTQTVTMAHVQSEVNTYERTWLKAGNLHLGVLPFPTNFKAAIDLSQTSRFTYGRKEPLGSWSNRLSSPPLRQVRYRQFSH